MTKAFATCTGTERLFSAFPDHVYRSLDLNDNDCPSVEPTGLCLITSVPGYPNGLCGVQGVTLFPGGWNPQENCW